MRQELHDRQMFDVAVIATRFATRLELRFQVAACGRDSPWRLDATRSRPSPSHDAPSRLSRLRLLSASSRRFQAGRGCDLGLSRGSKLRHAAATVCGASTNWVQT